MFRDFGSAISAPKSNGMNDLGMIGTLESSLRICLLLGNESLDFSCYLYINGKLRRIPQ